MLKFIAAGAATIAAAAPAVAQYPYPQPYPQTYPGYPQQTYPGYPGYGAQNPVQQIIDQLLGNRYNVTDRRAVSLCASAAVTQAQAQYRGYGGSYGGYSGGYGGYNQPYGQGFAAPAMRVTAITDVQRRSNGLRVKGRIDTGYGGYAGQYAYQNQAYARGDLSFRCNVDYRGAVTNVRINREANTTYRRY
jgi:hypothetical protein